MNKCGSYTGKKGVSFFRHFSLPHLSSLPSSPPCSHIVQMLGLGDDSPEGPDGVMAQDALLAQEVRWCE